MRGLRFRPTSSPIAHDDSHTRTTRIARSHERGEDFASMHKVYAVARHQGLCEVVRKARKWLLSKNIRAIVNVESGMRLANTLKLLHRLQ
jgi:hypothetical protein